MQPYKVPATQHHQRSRLQLGIDQCEGVHEAIDHFVNGLSVDPGWVSLLSSFRAGLDFIKADAAILERGTS